MALKQGKSIALQEDIDPDYEPSTEGVLSSYSCADSNLAVYLQTVPANYCYAEIADYAQWLGLDLEAEKELVWICREGLKAKLPADWKAL